MMNKKALRKADFVTSIILLIFGIWELSETFTMPMQDYYGGVESHWYVSPALLPLFIGISLIIFGIILLINSIKCGGAKDFIDGSKKIIDRLFKNTDEHISRGTIRFLIIVMALFIFVFINIPRIDFFISIILFLLPFISIFYIDDYAIIKKGSIFFFAGNSFIFLLFLTGVSDALNAIYVYMTDALGLLLFISFIIFLKLQIKDNKDYKKKLLISILVTFIVPLILVPIFRYFLLVPLPKEGMLIRTLNSVYYYFKY